MAKKNLFEDDDEEPQQEFKSNKNQKKKQQGRGQEESEEGQDVKLKINKNFAQKFEAKVQRQLIDKAKAMYGSNYEQKMEEENAVGSSEDVEEDSDGELLNEKVSEKFIETLAKIRQKDPSIYKQEKKFFKEKDFELEKQNNSNKNKEKLTYVDMVRKDALEKMDREDYSSDDDEDNQHKGRGETIAEEQKRLKDEFKRAAKKLAENNDDDEEEEDADKIFTKKKKSNQQIENENQEYSKFLEKMKKKKSRKGKSEDIETLQNFWGDEKKLDDTDKFLRKYIMTKGWVDKDDMGVDEDFEQEDEQNDDEADKFEAKYNFRYEEPDANEIKTYGRQVVDSLRQKDSKRAESRKDRENRKKEEKKQIEEEMKLMKSATKKAILERVHKIQEISGTKNIKADINKLLEEDFDDEKFTKQLEKQFDSDYYDQEDSNVDELKDYEKNIKKQQLEEQQMELEKLGLDQEQIKKVQKKQKKALMIEEEEEEEEEQSKKSKKSKKNQKESSSEWSDDDDDEEEDLQQNDNKKSKQMTEDDKDNVLNAKGNIPLAFRKQLKESEIQAMNQSEKGEDGLYLWWYCDNCKKGIQPGQHRFDCLDCPDYTLCRICNDGQFHDHPLKKIPVSKNCVPPTDEEILELLAEFKVCKKCNIKLDDYCSYYQLNSNEEVVLCDECNDLENYSSKKLYTYVEAKKVDLEEIAQNDPEKLKKHITDEDIQNLVNQYYNLDYEDVITGGIKTRFKYVDVQPESYGLSDDLLLYADTEALNKYVSIKKLAPYREDQGKVKSKNLKNKKYLLSIEKSAKINKKIIKKDTEKGLTTKEDLKALKKKDKKKYLLQLEKSKQEKQKEKEEAQEKEKPKLVLEDLSKQEKLQDIKVSKNRLKSYGF